MSGKAMERVPPAFIALFAVFFGTLIDALVRHVNTFVDLPTLIFFRFLIGALIVATPFFLTGHRLPGWKATRFHFVRGLIHLLASFFFFYALSKLELAAVTVLGFTAVLWITPAAWILLDEKPSAMSAAAGVLGFLGVVITFIGAEFFDGITRDDLMGFGSVMLAAVFYALSIVMLRKRASQDGAFAIAVYANAVPAILMLGPFAMFGGGIDWTELPWLIALGFCGSAIWVLMSIAYARAPAQQLCKSAPLSLSIRVSNNFRTHTAIDKGNPFKKTRCSDRSDSQRYSLIDSTRMQPMVRTASARLSGLGS